MAAKMPNARPRTLSLRELSDVKAEPVFWLWPGRIPLGKLSLGVGDPGVGKSFLTLDMAARVSRGGQWPDGGVAPHGNVLLLTAEDGISDTVRPRLDALGADVHRIKILGITVTQDKELSGLDLAQHSDLIEEHVARQEAMLVVVDPVLAFTGNADTNNQASVRGLLAPLAAMAERTGVAVVGIMHLNKNQASTNPLYRISNSLAFVAAARAAHLVAIDPNDPKRRLYVPIKSNLAAPSPALAFHFTPDGVLAWDGAARHVDVAALLAPSVSGQEGGKVEDACAFLLAALEDGPREVTTLRKEASGQDFSYATLRRAQDRLGIVARRKSKNNAGDGYWTWALPWQEANPQGAHTLSHANEHLADVSTAVANPQDAHGGNSGVEHLANGTQQEEAEVVEI